MKNIRHSCYKQKLNFDTLLKSNHYTNLRVVLEKGYFITVEEVEQAYSKRELSNLGYNCAEV